MDARSNLVLMGLRGSGKSTIGRALAGATGRRFIDLDDVTAAFVGAETVGEAWARGGEAGFREAESRALGAALRDEGVVLALGGGTPTAPGAAGLLRSACAEGRAVVVYLRESPTVLRERLRALGSAGLSGRPSLTGRGPLEEMEAVFEARDALYRSLASVVVEGVTTVEDAVERIRGGG